MCSFLSIGNSWLNQQNDYELEHRNPNHDGAWTFCFPSPPCDIQSSFHPTGTGSQWVGASSWLLTLIYCRPCCYTFSRQGLGSGTWVWCAFHKTATLSDICDGNLQKTTTLKLIKEICERQMTRWLEELETYMNSWDNETSREELVKSTFLLHQLPVLQTLRC
jgi:hypothetical protein